MSLQMPPIPEPLRICALCPVPCRSALGLGECPPETMMPSALSYLCYAVGSGYVEPDPEVIDALSQLEAARICQPRCVYGYRIADEIAAYAAAVRDGLDHAA